MRIPLVQAEPHLSRRFSGLRGVLFQSEKTQNIVCGWFLVLGEHVDDEQHKLGWGNEEATMSKRMKETYL